MCRPGSRCSPKRSSRRCDGGWSRTSRTLPIGARWKRAAISRPSSSRNCLCATSGRSFGPCDSTHVRHAPCSDAAGLSSVTLSVTRSLPRKIGSADEGGGFQGRGWRISIAGSACEGRQEISHMLRRYWHAVGWCREGASRQPSLQFPHLLLASVYAQSGQLEEAKAEVADVLRINPGFTIESYKRLVVYKDPKDTEHRLDGLRKAGLPEN